MSKHQLSPAGAVGVVSLENFRRPSEQGPDSTASFGSGGTVGGAGGGSDGPDMTNVTREELKDKLALAESHTDTKFAELRGDIKEWKSEVLSAIGSLPTKRELFNYYTTVIVIAIALVGIVVAAVTVSDARYLAFLARIPITVESKPSPPPP